MLGAVLAALSNYRTAFLLLGVVLGLIALVGSGNIRGHSLSLHRWQRLTLGLVSLVFLGMAVYVTTIEMRAASLPRTPYNIGGEWTVLLTKQDGTTRHGEATICQAPGSELIDMGMRTESRSLGVGQFYTFSVTGRIKGSRLVLYYDTPRGDRGLYLGDLHTHAPSTFSVRYYDITDKNGDTTGAISFQRPDAVSLSSGC